jgi:hypothetical protein
VGLNLTSYPAGQMKFILPDPSQAQAPLGVNLAWNNPPVSAAIACG